MKTALLMLSHLQKKYRIKGVVFSSSPPVIEYCEQWNLSVVKQYRTNKFGLPYFRNMLQTISGMYDARSYGYMNSDILLSELFIQTLPIVLDRLALNQFEASQKHLSHV